MTYLSLSLSLSISLSLSLPLSLSIALSLSLSGTPEEDFSSIAAVNYLSGIKNKFMACIGYGVDAFHGE